MVLGVIGLVASLLLPALSKVNGSGQARTCMNHLRQLGLATAMYADDFHDRLPGSAHNGYSWIAGLREYSTTNVYRCPTDPSQRFYSFALNDFLLPHAVAERDFTKFTSIPAITDTILITEKADAYSGGDHFHFADPYDGGYQPPLFIAQVAVTRHNSGANYLFTDTHVDQISWLTVQTLLMNTGSRFIHPTGHASKE